MSKNPMIHDYVRAPARDNVTPEYAPTNLAEAQRVAQTGAAPAEDAVDDDPDTQEALASEQMPTQALDRASAPIHKAFQGDCSLYAGPGKGIQAVREYKRS